MCTPYVCLNRRKVSKIVKYIQIHDTTESKGKKKKLF